MGYNGACTVLYAQQSKGPATSTSRHQASNNRENWKQLSDLKPNNLQETDQYTPFPDLLEKIPPDAVYYCKLDLVWGYYQILFQFTDWPVRKLQVSRLVLIEFAPSEWQNVFHIKCLKLFTFANGYLLLF